MPNERSVVTITRSTGTDRLLPKPHAVLAGTPARHFVAYLGNRSSLPVGEWSPGHRGIAPLYSTTADWVSAGRTGSIYKSRFSGLGEDAQIPSYEEVSSTVEEEFSRLTNEEKIALFKQYLDLSEDDFNFVFQAGIPVGIRFSTRGLDKIVEIRDKATNAFWTQNRFVAIWRRLVDSGVVPQAKLDHEQNVLKALRALAWITQEIANQANLNPSTRPVPSGSFFLSGLGAGPVVAVTTWFLMLSLAWKLAIVVATFLLIVGAVYGIVSAIASAGEKGVSALSKAPGKMLDALNQRPSVECDQADDLIAYYMKKGVSSLSPNEKSDLDWLLQYKNEFCRIPFYRSAIGLVSTIYALYVFSRYVLPYVQPTSSKKKLLSFEKDEPAIPLPPEGKPPKAGDKPSFWERLKRYARGVKTVVEIEYAKRKAFIECVRYADAKRPWSRSGRPPTEWKNAYNECRDLKDQAIPKATEKLSKEFLTYMKQTNLMHKPEKSKAKKSKAKSDGRGLSRTT